MPLPNRPALVRSGADGVATLKVSLPGPVLVQLTDPERNVLVRLPLGGDEVIQVGATTFRLKVSSLVPGR